MKTYDYGKGRYNIDSYRETDILDLSEFQKKSTERSLNSIYTFLLCTTTISKLQLLIITTPKNIFIPTICRVVLQLCPIPFPITDRHFVHNFTTVWLDLFTDIGSKRKPTSSRGILDAFKNLTYHKGNIFK